MPKRKAYSATTEIRGRIQRCRRALRKQGIGAFLVSYHRDCRYLSGFTGEDSALLITARDVHLITDRRFEEQIKQDCPWITVVMRDGLLNEEIARTCRRLRIRKLAVQSQHLSLASHAEIKRRAKGTRLVAARPVVAPIRVHKSKAELVALRRALRVAQDAFRATLGVIRPGRTERDLAAHLEFEMKSRGASGPAFPTICAEGANSALPHAHPGRRRIKKGGAVLFDWGARVDGYCSDLTRMVFIGSIPRRLEKVYSIVLEAQEAAMGAIKPGERMCDVDGVARSIIAEAGYGDRFVHGLGHGLGLDVHEAPALSWRSKAVLEPGMVVTVEPGIYLPGVGGVRIEDDVLVTSNGHRVMSRLDKRLDRAVLT